MFVLSCTIPVEKCLSTDSSSGVSGGSSTDSGNGHGQSTAGSGIGYGVSRGYGGFAGQPTAGGFPATQRFGPGSTGFVPYGDEFSYSSSTGYGPTQRYPVPETSVLQYQQYAGISGAGIQGGPQGTTAGISGVQEAGTTQTAPACMSECTKSYTPFECRENLCR